MADSQDLMRQIARAGAAMDPALTDRDLDRLIRGAARRRRRRRTQRILLAGTSSLALGLAALFWLPRGTAPDRPEVARSAPRPTPVVPPPTAGPRTLRFADGSNAVALEPATEMAVAEDTPARVTVRLTRGRGRFEVTPRPSRAFLVKVGEVTVSVLGTLFTVERVADRVGLVVEQGTVRVDWGVGFETLREGDSGWYPPLVKSPRTGRAVDRRTGARRASTAAPARSAVPARAATPAEAPASAQQLLAAADSARVAGRSQEGAALLRRLLDEHREDARAPLAAFTLGRVLLMELGRPRQAAEAFAEARRLSPSGPLAEDALAREAEAYSQAGATDLAKARAQEYLRRYPHGRRGAVARRMAGTP